MRATPGGGGAKHDNIMPRRTPASEPRFQERRREAEHYDADAMIEMVWPPPESADRDGAQEAALIADDGRDGTMSASVADWSEHHTRPSRVNA